MAASVAMSEKKPHEEEKAIFPVLTVFKNNTMIKNLFIILNNKNDDQTLLIGRHPSCNIVLTHPSISRFHLNIRFTPFSRSVSLLDLSSVHGTWVCGRKVDPGVSVDLKEGDTFTVGVSSRVYLLRFVSHFDVLLPKQLLQKHHRHVEEADSCSSDEEKKGQSKGETFGVLNGSFGTETSHCDDENKQHGCQNIFLSPPSKHSVDGVDDNPQRIEASALQVEMPGETNLLCTFKEYFTHNICVPVVEAVQGTKLNQFGGPPDTFTSGSEQPSSVEEFWFRSPTTIDPASFDKKDAVAAVAVMPKEYEFGCTSSDGEGDRIEEVFHSDNAGDSEFHQSKGDEQVSMDSPDTFTSEQPSYVEEFWFRSPTTIDPASFDKKDAVVAVAVMPKESEFGCTSSYGEGDRIEEVFHSDNAGDSEFHQSKVDEQVSVDSLSEGEKCCEEYESKFHNLNAKSCHERGYSQDEIVEDIGQKCIENVDPASFDENNVAAVTVIPEEHELGCTVRDNDMVGDISTTGARIFNSENTSLLVEEATPVTKIQQIVEEVSMDSISDGLQRNECDQEIQTYLNAKPCDEEGNSLHSIVEDTVKSFQVESLNPSVPQEADFNITNMKENHSSQSLVAMAGYVGVGILASGTEEATEKSSSSTFGSNSWSRRGKAASASAPQDRTRKSRFMSTNIISRSMSKDLFSVLDEEKMFTPNKENSSLLNTFHLQLMKKKGRPEESTHPKSQRSHVLKANYSPKFYPAGRSTSVSINQENWTPKLAQEWKSQRKLIECQDATELKTDRVDRVPLRSLMNSGGNLKLWNTDSVSAGKTIGGVTARASNCGQTSDKHIKPSHIREEHKRRWDMVVDTASLLNKESRKALQLLQGLKGTSLIIPQSVIRELGLIKQQYRFFRRTSEAALALEWIEECMEKTKGWIHIQSSMENPTPKNQFNSEDHILDCALQYRRKDHVGKIVFLSDDVTLKIKSMAKGLLCETVQQFRQSLVNPFSERFMWENSSPRGLTWSCQDDVVLRERYCGLPSKAGLKLITQQFL